MKAIITGLAAASLIFGLATAGTAAPQKKLKDGASKGHVWKKSAHSRRARDDAMSYREGNADSLPTGSNAWWQAMDREGRGGHNWP